MPATIPNSLTFRRLNPEAPVAVRAEACLPLRSRYAQCNRCVDICPVTVLHRDDEGFTLDDGCLGCGRCMAACPTGAIAVANFSAMRSAKPEGASVAVDCWRVPASQSPAGAVRVPCLGGLRVSDLFALQLAAGDDRVTLLDRGWCAECPACHGENHPAHAALNEANAWLCEAGVPAQALPRLQYRPLENVAPASPRIPDVTAAQSLSRRGFLDNLSRHSAAFACETLVGELAHSEPPPRTGHERFAPAPVRERERQYLLLQKLCAQHGREVPARFFPALTTSERCRNHRVCTVLCPTGALQPYDDGAVRGIRFDAAACIACGHCETVCPEKAVRLRPRGNGRLPRGLETLTRHALRECSRCGVEFSDNGDGELCLVCRRSQQFAKAGFDAMFHRHGNETSPSSKP